MVVKEAYDELLSNVKEKFRLAIHHTSSPSLKYIKREKEINDRLYALLVLALAELSSGKLLGS